jgi:hypothetical protein
MLKERFLQAMHDKHMVRITFYSEADKRTFIRVCAPLDYGPGKGSKDRSDRFHVWAEETVSGAHILNLKPELVSRVDVLNEEFDPGDYVWFMSRDWGQRM